MRTWGYYTGGGGGTCPLDEEEVAGPGQYVVQQPGPSRRHVAVDKQLDQHLHVNHNSPLLTSSVVIEAGAWKTKHTLSGHNIRESVSL